MCQKIFHETSEWFAQRIASSQAARLLRKAIERCNVFIVLLGGNTHQAQGVLREVRMARQLVKRRFQLRKQGHWPTPIEDAGEVLAWKWKNIKRQFHG